ncbi:MAG: hypothetical protein JO293_03225 [Candidatus Eremiobacteraeota bacterium]|nr:hypothetical protein [Candidatus Eremiobacteraeota bacterium]MBV8222347.1 hypothetical protein [Candidatus Eremiobacteraeota bacterium]
MHHSSRYAALHAAAEGTYGFPACVIPLRDGERSVADAIVALFADARVAIAADNGAVLPSPLPSNIVTFPRADFLAGALPRAWLEGLSSPRDGAALNASQPHPSAVRADATRRLRAILNDAAPAPREVDARALLTDEIAWFHASGIGFSAVAVSLAGVAPGSIVSALRTALRSSDRVAVHGESCVIMLPGEPAARAQRIAKRALHGVRKQLGLGARATAHMACAACPDDGDDAAMLLERLRI